MKQIIEKNKNFLYLLILLIFIIFLYSQEQCYQRFSEIFGITNLPILSYGVFIAMAFLFGALFLNEELKRLKTEKKIRPIKRNNETKYEDIFNFVLSFFLGYQLVYIINGHYEDFVTNPQIILSFHLESNIQEIVLYFIGGCVFTLLSFYINKKNKPVKKEFIESHELTGTLLWMTLVSGILGAKLFNVFETKNWQDIFSLGSGLTFYGGLIFGTITVILYARKKKISIPHLADAFAPILMLSYAIGRVSCQISGDGCWGKINTLKTPLSIPDSIWKCHYKFGEAISNSKNIDNYDLVNNQLIEGVFPTPMYETTICLILFFILWTIRKKIKTGGLLFSIYLILNGIERFFIEKIRVNDALIFNLTQAQIVAITLFLIGSVLLLYLLKKKKNAII